MREKNTSKSIIVTGGAGFIGSNIVDALYDDGYRRITIVDTSSNDDGRREYIDELPYSNWIEPQEFLSLVKKNKIEVPHAIIHFGARVDTSDNNTRLLHSNNTLYTKELFDYCVRNGSRLIYASSAATYGDGSKGFNDRERNLKPLNPYGVSKYKADEMILDSFELPLQWTGLKLFNVYGPRESYKGRMATMVFHGFNQIKDNGELKLFKSYKVGYRDGEQKRDHVYVKDVAKVVLFLLENKKVSGIFNLGTGVARTFLDLGGALFVALSKAPKITFIEMPEDIRGAYQYFTEAQIDNLRNAGYRKKFYSLEEGIKDYVQYLQKN